MIQTKQLWCHLTLSWFLEETRFLSPLVSIQVPGTWEVPGTLFQGLPVILRRAARFVITDKYDNESQGLNESQ